MKRPRPFSLKPIYIDERRELLTEIEQRARGELGLEPAEQQLSKRLHAAFAAKSRSVATRGVAGWMVLPMAMLVVIVFIVIWKFLL